MPFHDITKRYRISTQLAGMLAKSKKIKDLVTGIDFLDFKTGLKVRLNPVILHIKEKKITAHMRKEFNEDYVNFSHVRSEWLEFIEASFLMILSTYASEDFS